MDTRPGRAVSFSSGQKLERIEPNDMNALGRIGGWRVMENVDKFSGIVAQKHCAGAIVTRKAEFDFIDSARLGCVLRYRAKLAQVWTSSCMVFATVFVEDFAERRPRLIGVAWLLFVAVDTDGKPVRITHRLLARTKKERYYQRIAEAKKMRWLQEDKELEKILQAEKKNRK